VAGRATFLTPNKSVLREWFSNQWGKNVHFSEYATTGSPNSWINAETGQVPQRRNPANRNLHQPKRYATFDDSLRSPHWNP